MSQLWMEKSDLANVPSAETPNGYGVRTFCPGDEEGLAHVYAASQLGTETAAAVRERMIEHPCFRPERIFVATADNRVVGTAAAWIEDKDPGVGYLHMVGVMPECRSAGLGRVLTVRAIGYTHAEGLVAQRLYTDDWRESAIRLYLGLGYRPLYGDDTHPERWRDIARKLGAPAATAMAIDLR